MLGREGAITATTPAAADPLFQAAALGARAPSLHNSQPWRWRIRRDDLDLVLARDRVLRATDPDARLAILSCGAALHHARVYLAASGRRAAVRRLPDPADGDHLARLRLGRPAPIDPDAARLLGAVPHRRTDRRLAPSAPLDVDRLRPVAAAALRERVGLKLLRPRQSFDLAAAVARAQELEKDERARQAELAGAVTRGYADGTGVPETALPGDLSSMIVPGHGLHRGGAALISDSHHHASVFAILHGPGDAPRDWLVAGEALSACWLTATRLGVSVLPQSFVIEVPGARELVARLLGPAGAPYLVLRFAVADQRDDPPARTPRLPIAAIIERVDPADRPE